MHTPIGECTSDCRRVGCPEMMTAEEAEEELIAMQKEELARAGQHSAEDLINLKEAYDAG